MKTPYSVSNAAFTEHAHLAARRLIYPDLFGLPESQLSFENTLVASGARGQLLDGELGIDRIVKVRPSHLRAPMGFTVQERFRKTKYADRRDITVTEWNRISNKPSELYKMAAGLFVYGYYDSSEDQFTEAVVIDSVRLRFELVRETINFTRGSNPRTNQPFICFTFEDLMRGGFVLLHHRPFVFDPVPF